MRDMERGKPICIKCKKAMVPTEIKLGEITTRAWRCTRCREELIHPLDAEQALLLAKLRKGIKVKVGWLNRAPYLRLPKEFSKLLRKGDVISVTASSTDKLFLKIIS